MSLQGQNKNSSDLYRAKKNKKAPQKTKTNTPPQKKTVPYILSETHNNNPDLYPGTNKGSPDMYLAKNLSSPDLYREKITAI